MERQDRSGALRGAGRAGAPTLATRLRSRLPMVHIAWAMVIGGVAVMVVAFLLMLLKKNRST